MEIQGHFQDGIIVPHDNVFLPDGTEVTITVRSVPELRRDAMSVAERERYLSALTKIDAVANENPSDTFRGADHDRVLYGNG